MQDFLNPKSMITPGVAGGLVMLLVNGICCPFPEIPERYLALILSFVVGSILWTSDAMAKSPRSRKVAYWVINSLIIFVTGFGTANLAADAVSRSLTPGTSIAWMIPSAPSALAQDDDTGPAALPGKPEGLEGSNETQPSDQSVESLEEQLAQEKAEKELLQQQLASLQEEKQGPGKTPEPSREKSLRKFFKRW